MPTRRKVCLVLFVFCSCFVTSLNCFGQASKSEDAIKISDKNSAKTLVAVDESEEVIRVETNLIMNDVLVFDRNGKPVKDLKISDFVIKEDDEPQEISVFSFGAETIPRSIVLIIDYSGSQLPYIQTSVEAAKVLVDKLNPQDRMAIVNDNVELVQDFTTDKSLLKEKLEALKQSALAGKIGQSRQYSALMKVLNETFTENESRPIVIFQTDGDELTMLKNERSDTPKESKVDFDFNDVLTASEKRRATIYSIIPGMRFFGIPENEQMNRSKIDLINNKTAFSGIRKQTPRTEEIQLPASFLRERANLYNRQQSALNQIAQVTGGSTYYLEQPDQADKVYSEILSDLNVRYIIGYYPTNQNRDGRRRNVKIELPKYRDYEIRGRKTYILEEK